MPIFVKFIHTITATETEPTTGARTTTATIVTEAATATSLIAVP